MHETRTLSRGQAGDADLGELRLLDADEAAGVLGLTPGQVRRERKAGRFPPARKVGDLNYWVRQDLRTYVESIREKRGSDD